MDMNAFPVTKSPRLIKTSTSLPFPGKKGKLEYDLGLVSRKSRELFGREKPFVKVRPAYYVKLIFSYVAKGIETKITAKFRASRRLRFEDTKRIMSLEIRPKSSRTFEISANQRSLPGKCIGINTSELMVSANHPSRPRTGRAFPLEVFGSMSMMFQRLFDF